MPRAGRSPQMRPRIAAFVAVLALPSLPAAISPPSRARDPVRRRDREATPTQTDAVPRSGLARGVSAQAPKLP